MNVLSTSLSPDATPSEPVPVPAAPPAERASTRAERRAHVSSRFLDALESIVTRHRTLSPADHGELHAELIAAEVAHQLALVRAELTRIPPLRRD